MKDKALIPYFAGLALYDIIWLMQHDEFEKLVAEALDEIPEEFLSKLKNVAIVVDNEPNAEQLKKLKLRKNLTLLGLYEGVPQIKRGEYAMVLPDKISIFKNSIEQIGQTPEEIKELVKNTVRHEIAHHFGSGESGAKKAAKK